MKDSGTSFNFLSNHGHILIFLGRNPDARVRDIADAVGITLRAVQRILGELEEAGIVRRERRGRRSHYELNLDSQLRHPLESHHTVRHLIDALR